jgi:type IV secretory pathway VirB3-like protein
MDPHSRRFTWDVIRKQKEVRQSLALIHICTHGSCTLYTPNSESSSVFSFVLHCAHLACACTMALIVTSANSLLSCIMAYLHTQGRVIVLSTHFMDEAGELLYKDNTATTIAYV